MDIEPQVQRVYAKHGAAMSEAQLLEHYLKQTILAASALSGSRFAAEERAVTRLTIGALIRRLNDALQVPPRLSERLHAARIKQNWLAHEYFSSRSEFFQTRTGRAQMIRELDDIGEEFYQLWGHLDAALEIGLAESSQGRSSSSRTSTARYTKPNQRLQPTARVSSCEGSNEPSAPRLKRNVRQR